MKLPIEHRDWSTPPPESRVCQGNAFVPRLSSSQCQHISLRSGQWTQLKRTPV